MGSPDDFRWGSALGWSVGLFLAYGGIETLIGLFGWFIPIVLKNPALDRILYMGDKADVVYYGEAPRDLLARIPELRRYRTTMFIAFAAPLFAAGLLTMAIAWFGLRHGEGWALVALGIAGVGVFPHYVAMWVPYFRVGAPVFLAIPPYIWIPAALLMPALVLGWLGLRQGP